MWCAVWLTATGCPASTTERESSQNKQTTASLATVVRVRSDLGEPVCDAGSAVVSYGRNIAITVAHLLRQRRRLRLSGHEACQIVEHPGYLFDRESQYLAEHARYFDIGLVKAKPEHQLAANPAKIARHVLGNCEKVIALGYGTNASEQIKNRIIRKGTVTGTIVRMGRHDPWPSPFAILHGHKGSKTLDPGIRGGALLDEDGMLHGIVVATNRELPYDPGFSGVSVAIKPHEPWIKFARGALDPGEDWVPLRVDRCHPAAPFVRLLHRRDVILPSEVSGGLGVAIPRRLFARLVYRAFASSAGVLDPSPARFVDVPRSDPDYGAIRYAHFRNFIRADADGSFRPDDNLEYVEAVAGLVRGTNLTRISAEPSHDRLKRVYKGNWELIRDKFDDAQMNDLATAIEHRIAINLDFSLEPNAVVSFDYRGRLAGTAWFSRPLAKKGVVAAMVYQTLVALKKARPLTSRYVTYHPLIDPALVQRRQCRR